jgi:DNA mismatch endonuclease (patch repair protein)
MRRLLTERGVRYRLHRKDIPGTPDVYVGRLRLAIFVNGCFWHGHDCVRGRRPSTNSEFWDTKLERNRVRDVRTAEGLSARGIEMLTLWTCDTKGFKHVADDIAARYKRRPKPRKVTAHESGPAE